MIRNMAIGPWGLLSLLALSACGGSADNVQSTPEVSVAAVDESAAMFASQNPTGQVFDVKLAGRTDTTPAVLKGDVAFLGDIAIGTARGNQVVNAQGQVLASLAAGTGQVDRMKPMGTGIINSPNQRWPGGVIPYEIDGNANAATRSAFEGAKRDYDAKTVLRWVPRTNQAKWVRIITGDGCWSYLGTIGGRQDLSIGNGCNVNAARHEMGHALGLSHEQVRQDRDNYVKVNLELTGNGRSQFEIDTGSGGTPIGKYDFESMMHYSNAKVNGRWIFEPKNGFPPEQIGNGRYNTFSPDDLYAIEALYGKPGGGGGGGGNGSTVNLSGVESGRCLDAPKDADGTTVLIWDCNGGANQQWVRQSNGTLVSHGKCLDAFGSATANGSLVGLWSCHGGANQQWRFNGDGSVSNVASGLCLDVTGHATANDSPVVLWSCNGGNNQKWTVR